MGRQWEGKAVGWQRLRHEFSKLLITSSRKLDQYAFLNRKQGPIFMSLPPHYYEVRASLPVDEVAYRCSGILGDRCD